MAKEKNMTRRPSLEARVRPMGGGEGNRVRIGMKEEGRHGRGKWKIEISGRRGN